jgi:hypothetical protein
VVLFTTASTALAQSTSFSVPFKFEINGQVFDAGQYTLHMKNEMLDLSPAKGETTELSVLSRVAGPGGANAGARIVFDKSDNAYYLSEIWFAGQDGFLLRYTIEKHTHVFVNLGKGATK